MVISKVWADTLLIGCYQETVRARGELKGIDWDGYLYSVSWLEGSRLWGCRTGVNWGALFRIVPRNVYPDRESEQMRVHKK